MFSKKTIAENLLPVLIEFVGKDSSSGLMFVIDQMMKFEQEGRGIGGPLVEAFEKLKKAIDDVFQDKFQGDIKNVYEYLTKISDALGENIEILIDYGQTFTKWFVGITENTGNLDFALGAVKQSITGIGLLLTGGALLKGVSTISDLTKGLSGLSKGGVSIFKVLFRGKGSEEKDLSEKISEMEDKFGSFAQLLTNKYSTDADFSGIRKSVEQGQSQLYQLTGTTDKLTGAFKILGATVVSLGIGIAIGTWINGLKLFENGTVTVGAKLQKIFDDIFTKILEAGPIISKVLEVLGAMTLGGLATTIGDLGTPLSELVKSQDKVLEGFKKFADFKLPEDFLKTGLDKLSEYETSLKRQRDYFNQYITNQQTLFDQGAIGFDKYTKAVDETKKKIDEVNKSLEMVEQRKLEGPISDWADITVEIEAANKKIADYAQIVVDVYAESNTQIIDGKKQTNDILEKETDGSEGRKFESVKRTSKEILENEASKIKEAKDLYDKGAIDYEEYEKRKADSAKNSTDERIKNTKDQLDKLAGLDRDLNGIELAQREDLTKKLKLLEEEAANDRKGILTNRIEVIKTVLDEERSLYEENIANINLAEAEGKTKQEDAVKERLKLEEDFLKSKLELTQET